MKILVIAHLETKPQAEVLQNFLRFLDLGRHSWKLVLEKARNSRFRLGHLKSKIVQGKLAVECDVILVYNKKALVAARSFQKKQSIPVIYLLMASDFPLQYPDGFSLFERLFLLDAFDSYPKTYFPDETVSMINLPGYIVKSRKFDFSNRSTPNILIEAKGKECHVLNQMACLLNSLSHCRISIVPPGNYPAVFGDHVSILRPGEYALAQLIRNADLVIGEGRIIEEAIAKHKLCIVAGNKGYGGLIHRTNFLEQYKTGFKGRIGGDTWEVIPGKLVMSDICYLQSRRPYRLRSIVERNAGLLKQEYRNAIKYFNQVLHEEIRKTEIICCELQQAVLAISQRFEFMPFLVSQYVIRDKLTKKSHGIIEAEEYLVVRLFNGGSKVKHVMQKSGLSNEMESFEDFIRHLVREKVLVLVV